MSTNKRRISVEPKNPFRALLALKRVLADPEDLDANVEEAAIVQFAFNRSRFGRRIARWDLLAQELAAASPRAADLMARRVRLPAIDLSRLSSLPPGTLGHEFARHALDRAIDPDLVEKIPATNDGDWLMAYAYETHDLWHLMTGFYYDLEGEFGVAGFYLSQMPRFSFVAAFTSLLMIRTVWTDRDAIAVRLGAFVEGYEMGKRAENLMGLDWGSSFERNLAELRDEWRIADAGRFATPAARAA